MKLTSRKLKRVVKEEVQKFLKEDKTKFVVKDKDSGWYVDGNVDIGMTGWVETPKEASKWDSKEKAEFFVRNSEAVSRIDVDIIPKDREV